MLNKMNDMVRTVIILSVIAVLSGGILGLFNSFTQVDPEEQLKAKLILVYDNPSALTKVALSPSISPIADADITAYGTVDNVFTAPDGTYVMKVTGKGGYGGDVQLLYAIKDNKIIKIAKYAHAETPGLGSKGFKESYLSQYIGKDISTIDKFTITKYTPANDSQIKAISGATYSSGAIANATNIAAYWYNLNGPYAVDEA